MANAITTVRFALVFLLVALAYQTQPLAQLAAGPLLIVIFALDGLDGYVARKRGEESLFGSVYDIAVDRIVENILWVVLANLGLVPLWVSLLFITRGLLVDAIRSQAAERGETPFGMMRTAAGRFLVAGRFMRMLYGVVKGATFTWMFALQPLPALAPRLWEHWAGPLQAAGLGLVWLSVALCLLRGIPVVVEFAAREGGPLALHRRAAGSRQALAAGGLRERPLPGRHPS